MHACNGHFQFHIYFWMLGGITSCLRLVTTNHGEIFVPSAKIIDEMSKVIVCQCEDSSSSKRDRIGPPNRVYY